MGDFPRESNNNQEFESSEELEFDPKASLEEKLEFVNECRGSIPAILAAAEFGDLEVCEELVLNQGADVNVIDDKGYDVYHCAAMNIANGVHLIGFFMDHSAKMERKNSFGLDAVIKALGWRNFEFARKMFNAYESQKSFISHCIYEGLDLLKYAFEMDPSVVKVNGKDEFDKSISYDAACTANIEKFKWIMEIASRIDQNLVKSKEWQLEILRYAALNAKHGEEIARFMFSDHIKNGVTREESTDLLVRVMSSDSLELVNFEVVKMFVARGANLNNVIIEGKTLLDHCVAKGSIRAIQFVYNLTGTGISVDTLLTGAWNLGIYAWLVDRLNDPWWLICQPFSTLFCCGR